MYKRQLLAFLFATSSCTTTHNEGAAAVELFPPPLMGWSSWNTYHVNTVSYTHGMHLILMQKIMKNLSFNYNSQRRQNRLIGVIKCLDLPIVLLSQAMDICSRAEYDFGRRYPYTVKQ